MLENEKIQKKLKTALHLKEALRLVWKSGPKWTISSIALYVIQGLLPLLSLYLMKLVVDAVAAGLIAPDKAAVFKEVFFYIGLSAGVVLAGALFATLAGLVASVQSLVVTDYVQDILHSKSIEMDLEYYENSEYFDTLHRAQKQAPFRPTNIVRGLAGVGQSGIAILGIAGLLFALHWALIPILFFSALPAVFIRIIYANKMYDWERSQTPSHRWINYLNSIITSDVYAKEVRLFGLGSLFKKDYGDLRKLLRKEVVEIISKRSFSDLVSQTVTTMAIFGSFAFIAYGTILGTSTIGDLVMLYQALQRGQNYLRQMLLSLSGLYEDNLFLADLHEFLNLEPKIGEPTHPKTIPKPIQKEIVFDRVGFKYPTGTREVLKDISMTIRPGEKVALVGGNGTGKTTLVKLLCRLYDPSSGRITIDGIDIREFEKRALRGEISVVFQDYAKYHFTARKNIWLGNIDTSSDHKKIVEAAQFAGADEVINSLPNGYDTLLGKRFEKGEELSIGEWQKVALARAFMREAQIIILDEPTSALDAKAEFEVFKRFNKLAEGKTAILISHRLSSVRMVDKIYVLDEGRIIESGTHDELIRNNETYHQLFETQAQYYR